MFVVRCGVNDVIFGTCLRYTQYNALTTIHPISNVYFLFLASWWKAMLIYKECKNGRSILLHILFFSLQNIASVAYSFGCSTNTSVATYDCALCIPCIFIKAFTTSHISKSIGVHAANNRIFLLFFFHFFVCSYYHVAISVSPISFSQFISFSGWYSKPFHFGFYMIHNAMVNTEKFVHPLS